MPHGKQYGPKHPRTWQPMVGYPLDAERKRYPMNAEAAQAMQNETYRSRVTAAATILGITSELLAEQLVTILGADTPADLEAVGFQDLTENLAAKPIKARRALSVLRRGEDGPPIDRQPQSHLLQDLKDEEKLWRLTDGKPLLCDAGGSEHSAANIRYYRKTGAAPKTCCFPGCGKRLAHAKGEVSFEDGKTFLTADGLNPNTGRNEGQFPLADRALAYRLIQDGELTLAEAWGFFKRGELRDHFKVEAADIADADPAYIEDLRKPFGGVRTGSPTDPFYRKGHVTT